MDFLSNTEYKSILGYLPATIIKNVIETKVALTAKLPRHYVTESVGLFSDISGFTKLSEAFSKKGRVGAEFLTFCINRYMEGIINIIGANGGDIFKFVGDAIMVIWPPDGSPNFLKNACKRACQCAMDIQRQLNDLEIIEGKKLSVKIGLGIGQCHILFVGGLFGRCEYLCVGECMRQACESETHSERGGQIIMSEKVRENVDDCYFFEEAKVQPGYKKNDNLKYYLITGEKDTENEGTTKKADAFLMRKMFDIKRVREKVVTLRQFLPAAVKGYLNIEKEDWCKEIRLVTTMFLNIKVDLSQLKDESDYMKVQIIANTVQRSIYRTRGSLNKFLMDDKGSVMLVAWGLPPMSSKNDALDAVSSCITILHEFDKLGFQCAMGLTTGTFFSGVCGTVGNRIESSMLGEVVNLASRYMSAGLTYMAENKLNNILVIDERTKNLIQNKIRCKYLFRKGVKGFDILFNFFTPVTDENEFFPTEEDPFPFIRTHCNNPIPFYNIEQYIVDQGEDQNKKKTNNRKNYLKNSLEMAGRTQEFEAFVTKLNDVYKKKIKKFIMIKGQYGCGKSFFIRKGLYSFFKDIESNQELSEFYFNNPELAFPNFVLCNYQTPMLEHIPFNGVSMIFRQIYLWLTNNYFKKENNLLKEINVKIYDKDESNKYPFESLMGDELAKLICKNHCLDQLEAIEEMLATSKEDIQLKIHFGAQDYTDKVLPYIEQRKKLENKNNQAKPRDPYFSNLEIKNDIHIINFLIELLILYKEQINTLKKTKIEVPLFLVIEDTHYVDKYTIAFIYNLLYNDYPELKPLIVILSYQEEFKTLKRRNDLMIKEKQILNKMTLSEFKKNNKEMIVNNLRINNITSIQEIEEFIKIYVLENDIYERFDSLFKVDPNLIRTLIDKSYGGNPLLIRDLLEEFIKKKYIQNCVSEILITSELDDMEKLRNWNDFIIPLRIEKICGEMIDSLHEKDIIMLKHAATIGNLFDIQTLLSILPFKGLTLPDLYRDLKKIEKKGMIENLYDLDHKKKTVVYKFCCPFLKETLYQRMLIEQRNEIHMKIARSIQKNRVSYLPNLKLEKLNLRKQLENGQKSIINEMEEHPANDNKKENNEVLNINSLKILIVKEICDKLKYMKNYSDDEIEQVEGKEKLAQALKYGMVEKKSDGKITWENRFFVVTTKHISYYYHLDEYISDKVPLATFELKDIFELKQLSDSSYGNKKNIFQVSVSKWIKKEQIKGKRSYIFSCKSVEDLYSWVITINFLKANAYYNIFTSHFGKIGLPLYKFSGKKLKKFFFNLDDKLFYYNDIKSALSTNDNIPNTSQIKKVSVSIEKAIKLPELQKKVAKMVSNVFLCILGDIQYRLVKFNNDIKQDENEISEIIVPPHLKSCDFLRNPDYNDEISKEEEEEEEEKSENKEDNKDEEKLEEIKEEEIKEEEKEDKKEDEDKKDEEEDKKEEENSKSNGSNKNIKEKVSSQSKKEIIISEKISEDEKIKNKEEKLKNKKSELSDITDVTKNNNKIITKEEENEDNNNSLEDLDDIDDMNFDMNEEEEDTHYPKYFVKDKSIIQLKDNPDSIHEINNQENDSQNAFD